MSDQQINFSEPNTAYWKARVQKKGDETLSMKKDFFPSIARDLEATADSKLTRVAVAEKKLIQAKKKYLEALFFSGLYNCFQFRFAFFIRVF